MRRALVVLGSGRGADGGAVPGVVATLPAMLCVDMQL